MCPSHTSKKNAEGFLMGKNSDKDDKDKQGKEDANEEVKEYGQLTLDKSKSKHKVHLLSVIGEIEGHEVLSSNTKTTKYEHVLPQLAAIEDNCEIEGLLILINTVGGDVEAGLAIAEMIASLSKPTVSLVLGGSHSIGVPIAVSSDYSFIVPSGTMVIHPVRTTGMVIGVKQSFDYFKQMQDRIVDFITDHCDVKKDRLVDLMMETSSVLTKDIGSILVGEEAVDEGVIDEVGGVKEAVRKLHEMIENQ